ncbi:MAG: hypothetical protein ACLU9S_05120 [Oscillospiraceae bacterium]
MAIFVCMVSPMDDLWLLPHVSERFIAEQEAAELAKMIILEVNSQSAPDQRWRRGDSYFRCGSTSMRATSPSWLLRRVPR